MTLLRIASLATLLLMSQCAHNGLVGWHGDEFTVTCRKAGAWKDRCGPDDWKKVAERYCSGRLQLVAGDVVSRALSSEGEASDPEPLRRTYRCSAK